MSQKKNEELENGQVKHFPLKRTFFSMHGKLHLASLVSVIPKIWYIVLMYAYAAYLLLPMLMESKAHYTQILHILR